jgi:FHA domain-containing protein
MRPSSRSAPAVVPPPGLPDPAPPRPAAPASAAGDAEALWAAFCDGAGIRLPLPAGQGVQQMQIIGRVLREAVEGTLKLMALRTSEKQALRAAVTIIHARNNNPLKFAPDAQLAMEQLMQPPLRGFMPAPAAMQDAMHDLMGHGVGTMAGMRAALAAVLQRFEPRQLESRMAEHSMLDSLLPMNRKARLWDLFLQHFEAIRNEAQDDFQTLFGKAFVAAYEEQQGRLPRGNDGA